MAWMKADDHMTSLESAWIWCCRLVSLDIKVPVEHFSYSGGV